MTDSSNALAKPEVFWRRWLRWLAAFETAMEMTYDDLQDRRIDRLEAEVANLRLRVIAFSEASID